MKSESQNVHDWHQIFYLRHQVSFWLHQNLTSLKIWCPTLNFDIEDVSRHKGVASSQETSFVASLTLKLGGIQTYLPPHIIFISKPNQPYCYHNHFIYLWAHYQCKFMWKAENYPFILLTCTVSNVCTVQKVLSVNVMKTIFIWLSKS